MLQLLLNFAQPRDHGSPSGYVGDPSLVAADIVARVYVDSGDRIACLADGNASNVDLLGETAQVRTPKRGGNCG